MSLRKVPREESDRDAPTQALLSEYERALEESPDRESSELPGGDLGRLSSGRVQGAVWMFDGRAPSGLAAWDFLPGVGRRVRLYLTPEHRSARDLGQLLDELDERSEHDGPIASVVDFVPGVPDRTQEEAMTARSFFRVERVALRRPPETSFPDEDLFGRPDLRELDAADEEPIARLMREAYDQTAGEPTPWYLYRDPRQDARDAVQEILDGRRGEWLPWASFGLEVGQELLGASLVTRAEFPVLSEVMVAPRLRRIGMGFYLGLESIRVLVERNFPEIRAVTTSTDLRALRLARRLGFEPAEERAVGLWVNRVAIGVSPPARRD